MTLYLMSIKRYMWDCWACTIFSWNMLKQRCFMYVRVIGVYFAVVCVFYCIISHIILKVLSSPRVVATSPPPVFFSRQLRLPCPTLMCWTSFSQHSSKIAVLYLTLIARLSCPLCRSFSTLPLVLCVLPEPVHHFLPVAFVPLSDCDWLTCLWPAASIKQAVVW